MTKHYPTRDELGTHRDNALHLLYGTLLYEESNPQLEEAKAQEKALSITVAELDGGKEPSNLNHQGMTLEKAKQELRAIQIKVSNMEDERDERLDWARLLLFKREGFLAGLRFAALALEHKEKREKYVLEMARALSDDEYADMMLNDLTMHLPSPSTDPADFRHPAFGGRDRMDMLDRLARKGGGQDA